MNERLFLPAGPVRAAVHCVWYVAAHDGEVRLEVFPTAAERNRRARALRKLDMRLVTTRTVKLEASK